MKIDRAGVFQIADTAYHGDPCAEPSLSSTVARVLINKTPRHAWTESPRLNPDWTPRDTSAFDIGRACHQIVLGRGGEFEVIAAENYQTKAAQAARDAARAAGRGPILLHQYNAALRMAEVLRKALDGCGVKLDPARSEMAAIAKIEGVWCRALVDNALSWPTDPLYDYKTCLDASLEACIWSIEAYGYDFQMQWYRETWKAATGEDRPFRFIFQEKEPPHAVRVVELWDQPGSDADWTEDASEKCAEARRIWRLCLETGEWPAYPLKVSRVGARQFYRARWATKETIAPEAKPSAEALRAAAEFQAPPAAE